MPVCLDGNSASHKVLARAISQCGRPDPRAHEGSNPCISIGLINNMPDSALEATERQFLSLLDSAAEGIQVRLSLYALPDVPRGEAGRNHISRFYSGIERLRNSKLDGLIVTGREPREPNLRNEPYWRNLTGVIDWADDNTHSTIWSCLAAHAAVLHTDGISRYRNSEKRYGILECHRSSANQLMAGVPSNFNMPHSRWNDVREEELTAHGYGVLARTEYGEADTFVKRRNSLFVFFQGHPEYESNTLWLEYCRDAGRYLRGQTDRYPAIPQTYFDQETVANLKALQDKSMSDPTRAVFAGFENAVADSKFLNVWSSTARRIYRNWLGYIEHKVRCAREVESLHSLSTVPGGPGL